jgi:hypothetical protein
MPFRGHQHDEGEGDEELTPYERRAAFQVQRELLAVLHSDREARTRASDGGALSRTLAAAVPFVLGVLIGVLGTISLLSGRIATLEAESKAHGDAIARGADAQAKTLELVQSLDVYVRSTVHKP